MTNKHYYLVEVKPLKTKTPSARVNTELWRDMTLTGTDGQKHIFSVLEKATSFVYRRTTKKEALRAAWESVQALPGPVYAEGKVPSWVKA